MKQVLGIILGLVSICLAVHDFYTDEDGRTYSIGLYGNRQYNDRNRKQEERIEPKLQILNFATNFFKNVDAKGQNIVVSPISPQILLSTLAPASTGRTQDEIIKVTGYENSRDLEKLINEMQKEPSPRELKIANGFFVDNSNFKNIRSEFWDINYAKKHVNEPRPIDVVNLNFKDSAKSKNMYQKWVAEKTKGAIKDADISIDENMKLIMASTVYFKGNWLFDFPTIEKVDFTLTNGETVLVEAMRTRRKYHGGKFDHIDARWGVIPYNGTEAMIIILPNKPDKLDEVIDQMNGQDIKDILGVVTSSQTDNFLNVSLPKFTIKSFVDLKQPLKTMNLNTIFTSDSELNILTNSEPLSISKATQQTLLEVNEVGSIGASTSTFSAVALSITPDPVHADFFVDKPFAAIIVDRKYGVPYFMAKIYDPRA